MRLLILKDPLIQSGDLEFVLDSVADLYKSNCGIDPYFTVREISYQDQSGTVRANFDGLPYGFLDKHVRAVHAKDAYAFDHIVFMVHENNWKPTQAIWGENFSNFWWTYHVEVCRFDKDNMANSIGTLYHEIHHSHDALIETMLGIKVEPLIGVSDWDAVITHGNKAAGGHPVWKYIRFKENESSIMFIADLLRKAYDKHLQLHLKEKISLLQKVVQLTQQVIVLQRSLLIKNASKCQQLSQDC
jgi:hypothetical protein